MCRRAVRAQVGEMRRAGAPQSLPLFLGLLLSVLSVQGSGSSGALGKGHLLRGSWGMGPFKARRARPTVPPSFPQSCRGLEVSPTPAISHSPLPSGKAD